MSMGLVIQVPVGDQPDLERLLVAVASQAHPIESRPFDGATLVQALVILSPATYPFFRTWITARSERAKNTYVSIDGMRLRGFTAKEVVRLTKEIDMRVTGDESDLA